jgi:hypothetical protein
MRPSIKGSSTGSVEFVAGRSVKAGAGVMVS